MKIIPTDKILKETLQLNQRTTPYNDAVVLNMEKYAMNYNASSSFTPLKVCYV